MNDEMRKQELLNHDRINNFEILLEIRLSKGICPRLSSRVSLNNPNATTKMVPMLICAFHCCQYSISSVFARSRFRRRPCRSLGTPFFDLREMCCEEEPSSPKGISPVSPYVLVLRS